MHDLGTKQMRSGLCSFEGRSTGVVDLPRRLADRFLDSLDLGLGFGIGTTAVRPLVQIVEFLVVTPPALRLLRGCIVVPHVPADGIYLGSAAQSARPIR